MWSRLAKVATDLAQDLAQPEEEGEEEEYYEGESLDDGGWAEEDGEVQPLQTPAADAAVAVAPAEEYYQEGEEAYTEDYGEEGWGEEQQQQQQQYYEEGGETQPVYQEEEEEGQDDYQEEGWGDEVDLDAGVEAAPASHDDEYYVEEQPYEEEPPDDAVGQDDWDLEDEDLFGDEEGEQQQQQEEAIIEGDAEETDYAAGTDDNYNHDTVVDDQVVPEDDNNNNNNDDAWDNDDSFNFDDSLLETEDVAAAADDANVQQQQQEPEVTEIENEIEENEWGHDDSLNFDDSHRHEGGPVEEAPMVEESGFASEPEITEIDNNLVENDWANDDSLNFDDSNRQEEEGEPVEEAPLVDEGEGAIHDETLIIEQDPPVEEDTPVDENAWGEDDLGLDDSFAPADNNVTGDETMIAQQEEVQDQPDPDTAVAMALSHDTFDTAEENQENAWNDDLAFDDDDNNDNQDTTTATDNGGVAATSDLMVQESHDTFDTAEQAETQHASLLNHVEDDALAEEGSGWNDDDDVDAMLENEGADAWGGDDNLNLSVYDEEGDAPDIVQPLEPELSEQVADVPTEENLHHDVTTGTLAADSADAWGDDDDLNLSDDVPATSAGANSAGANPGDAPHPDDVAGSSLASVVNQEDDLQVFEDEPTDNVWNDSDIHFDVTKDDKKVEAAIPDEQQEVVEEEQGEDDSTVEQSNIGFEQQSVEELPHARRATIRMSNASAGARKDAAGGVDTFGEQILGTSVSFTEQSTVRKTPGQPSSEPFETSAFPNGAANDLDHIAEESSVNQDALSTVSDLTDIPKPRFETQISTMTLKSMADSRQNANGSDDDEEDNEDDYGLVVDKTPELNAASTPELSTMTINSTAVVAPSVNDDIQKDEDMDGTFYGGSATGEAQSTENAWEDDASSLGGLSEKMVNFEVTASALVPPHGIAATPLTDTIPEETTNALPPLDSSMALLYADDTSVPSRDKDDDNEDNYKPVVDQIPRPLKKKLLSEKFERTVNSTGALTDIPDESENNEESSSHRDTEGGQADGWDDGASLEDIDSHDDTSDDQDGSATAEKGESHIVVDKTPNDAGSTSGGKATGSVAAVESVENSCPSRVHGDDEEVYGLVVDQIPALTPPSVLDPSVAASCMAVAANVDQDLRQDEELDGSDRDDSVLGELGVSSEATEGVVAISSGNSGGGDRVVDLTPKMGAKKMSRLSSGSLVVLAHSINQDFADEDNDEDNDANFGPVVDMAAVQAIANTQDGVKHDETTNGSIGDVGWDDDCPELEEMDLGEEAEDEDKESDAGVDVDVQPSGVTKQVVLVDHTPEAQAETPRKAKGDASLAVLAPSEDGTCLSINDNDDDADTIDPHGERVSYGPVVDHTPNLPSELARAPSTALSVTFSLAVEARSVDDQTLEELDDQTLEDMESVHPEGQLPAPPSGVNTNPEGEVMVDHTPHLSSLQPRMGDASLVTLAPSETGTFHSADASARDDDTITHEENMYGKVVDHTPRTPIPFVKSTSMAVETSSADLRSVMEHDGDLDATSFDEIEDDLDGDGWGEDDDALGEIDADEQIVGGDQPPSENLVDHTPEGEEQPTVVNTDPSVAVLAPSEEGSHAEDNIDPNDAIHAYGPVVDVCPGVDVTHEAPDGSTVAAKHDDGDLEGTLFGDSTVGGETGWDDDDAILDDLVEGEGDVETIGASSSHAVRWQKNAESSDNASSQMDDSTVGKSLTDAASSHDGVAVVDHTPSEVDSSAQKNSVGWLTNVESGISGDETAQPVVSWEVNDGVEPPSVAADENQVVDRIPQRPESRFGDASTIVVADPSELLSHVGDMLQEEGDFGPVVDLTPPTRPASALTATGSTAVVAPTVVNDDLDDADPDPDDTVDAAADENVWADDPAEAPNPQSGNEEDEAARRREQVVDFLPPQEEQAADPNRDGWSEASELATGGAPSVLQADPKEDDYGPVVDQLPLPFASAPSVASAALSTTSQVAASECAAMADEDEKTEQGSISSSANNVVAMQTLDSTASLAQSLASEDEDDDDGKYGPVVDHLPPRSSLPPSRGGSTVDALATVSEVIDDDDDDGGDGSSAGGDDGWGDDDLGEIALLSPKPPPPSSNEVASVLETKDEAGDQSSTGNSDRGMTVRFRSVVAAIFESNAPAEALEAGNTNDQDHQATSAEAGDEIFHDAGAGVGDSNAWDDDLDFDMSLNMDSSRATDGEDVDRSLLSSPDKYTQFTEADTPPATPYRKTKTTEPSGLPLNRVSLPELALPPVALSMECSTCANASTIDCPCVQRVLKQKEDGDDTIRIDFNKLLQTEISKRRLIEEESKDLRKELERVKTSKSVGEVQSETIITLQQHVNILEDKLKDTGNDYETLHTENQRLQQSISEARTALSGWEESQREWTHKEAMLREEVEKIQRDLEESLYHAGAQEHEKEQSLLAAAKEKEEHVQILSRTIEELQEQCSRLQDENNSLASDLEPLKQALAERDEKIHSIAANEASCQVEIQRLSGAIQELETENESHGIVRQQCATMETELASKQSECEKLTSDITLLQQRVQAAEGENYKHIKDQAKHIKQHQEEISRYEDDLAAARAELEQLSSIKSQNASLASDVNRLGVVAQQKEQLEEQLQSAHAERDTLLNSLRDSNEQVTRLQKQIEDQGIEEGTVEASKNREIDAMLTERADLQNVIIANKSQLEGLEKRLERFEDEKQALQASAENARLEAERVARERSEISTELNSLKQEVAAMAFERDAVQEERSTLALKIEQLESSLRSAEQQAESNSSRVNELDEALAEAQSRVSSLQGSSTSLARERDQALDKCNQLEQMLANTTHSSQDSAQLTQDNLLLSEKVRSMQQESDDQNIQLQNCEARMHALENELATEKIDGARKAELESVVSRLEAERSELQQNLELLASKEEEFHGVCESLSNDRDTALQDKEILAAENEDLLVRFGEFNEEIEELQGLVHDYEEKAIESESQLLNLQERLASAEQVGLENGAHHAATQVERDSELENLRHRQNDLLYQIEELTNANAEKDITVAEITEELEIVRNQLHELKEVNGESTSIATDNAELRSTIAGLELQRSDLEAKLYDQSSELSQLQVDYDTARNASSTLEQQVNMLQEARSERDQALQQKENEMRGLVERLQETSGQSSGVTQEILDLRDKLNAMENGAREHSNQMHELAGNYDRSQREVASARASAEQLAQELSAKEEAARVRSEQHEAKVYDLENDLQWKSQELEELTQQHATLSTELNTVTSDLETERSRSVDQANAAVTGEVEALRAQLADLQEQLEASTAQTSEREQTLQAETNNLKRSLASKDGEVVMLKHKIQALSKNVEESRDIIEGQKNGLESMAKEKDDFENQQRSMQKAGSSSAAMVLQQTKENADDVDHLRSTVITLASALETSENRRADAIDRLLKERETYAESLRRLSASVKRFYNTLSFSET